MGTTRKVARPGLSPAAQALLTQAKAPAAASGEWVRVTLADVDVKGAPLADRDMLAGAIEVAALMVAEKVRAATVALAGAGSVKGAPVRAVTDLMGQPPVSAISLTRQPSGKVTVNLPIAVGLADGSTFHVNIGATLPRGPISDLLRPHAGTPRPGRD